MTDPLPERTSQAPAPTPSRSTFVDALLRRWFTADVRSLSAMRIGTGLVLLYDILTRAGDLEAHYSDKGVFPRSVLWANATSWTDSLSLNMLSGSVALQWVLVALTTVAALLLIAGWRTWLVTLASFVLIVSFQVRNPFVIYGGDFVLKMLLFWGLFLPWGARFSVDRWLASRRGQPLPPANVFSTGVAAAMLQVAIIYLFTSMLKTGAEWRSELTAIYYSLSLDDYIFGLGHVLYRYPLAMKLLTATSLLIELAAPFLLFWPVRTKLTRAIAVVSLVGLHMGIVTTMRVGFFPFISFVSLLVFVPREFWDRLGVTAGEERAVVATQARRGWLEEVATLAPVLLIGYVFAWNLGMPSWLHGPGLTLKIYQSWGMFSPYPYRDDGWWVLSGTLADGRRVDLMRDGAPIDALRRHGVIENERWRKWYRFVFEHTGADQASGFSPYLCRHWNERGGVDGQRVVRVDPVFVVDPNLPDYAKGPLYRRQLPTYVCDAATASTSASGP